MKSPSLRRARFPWPVLGLLALLAACSDDDPTGPDDAGTIEPVTRTVGTDGGTISADGGAFALEIPAGALAADVTFTVSALAGDDVPADLAALGAGEAWLIEPAGTDFAAPATVSRTIPVAKADEVTLRAVVRQTPEGPAFAGESVAMAAQEARGRVVSADLHATGRIAWLALTGTQAAVRVADNPIPCGGTTATNVDAVTVVTVSDVVWNDSTDDVADDPVDFTGQDGSLDSDDQSAWSRSFAGYACSGGGDGAVRGSVVFRDVQDERLLGTTEIRLDVVREVGCGTCAEDDFVGTADSPVTLPEGLSIVRVGFAAVAAAFFTLLVAGANNFGIVDFRTGLVLLAAFVAANSPRYGALPLSHPETYPDKDVGYVDAIFSFGPDGGSLAHYDHHGDPPAWGWSQLFAVGQNLTDGARYGGEPITAGVVYVNNSLGSVGFLEFDEGSGNYVGSGTTLSANQFPQAPGALVSAFAEAAGQPVLAVADGQPGRLYLHDLGAGDATAVGDVGDNPRRVRAEGGVFAVSNHGSGTLTIGTWDGATSADITATQAVGSGPVGIDLLDLGDGTVGIVSTGYGDDTYTLTVVDAAAGTVVSSTTSAAPAGCTAPGHAVWARDGSRRVIFTCNGSDTIATVDSGL